MKMTKEEKQAYNWALKQGSQSVAARYARILAKHIQRQDEFKEGLKQLGVAVRKPNLTIQEWKLIVKKFATKHGLTDREAIDLAELLRKTYHNRGALIGKVKCTLKK